MPQTVFQSPDHRSKSFEVVSTSFYMSQTRHQPNANRLNFVQMSLNSPPLIAIQFDVPQIVSTVNACPENCPKSSVSVSIS